MNKPMMLLLAVLCSFLSSTAFSQTVTTVTGSIKNEKSKESIPAVSVRVKGGTEGAYSDEKGNFRFTTTRQPPFTLVFSSIGYAPKELEYSSSGQSLSVELTETYALGQEIVVAASRLPERILESPVTIERMNSITIRNAPAPSYYDALAHLKGVDVTTSSYTFKTLSTRGFNGSGNLRFNQLVDGMDNSAPALNFSVGNIIGLSDLDVDNMELLSGASSALYGSGGMNGTLLITSKNPFQYQGVSFQVKQGIMHVNDPRHDVSPFYDWSLRWGKKLSEKFAFKVGAEYIKTDDWEATDTTDLARNNVYSAIKPGTRSVDPNYDGVNVYGDEASASLQGIAGAVVLNPATNPTLPDVLATLGINAADGLSASEQGQIFNYYTQAGPGYGPIWIYSSGIVRGDYLNADGSPILVSRTGYAENDLVDHNAKNLKVNAGLYYNINSRLQASLTGVYGYGTSVYTGSDRYAIKNFRIGQYKAELRTANWFLRGYTTQENSGDSYAQTLTALAINNAWKNNGQWFGEYTANYEGAILTGGVPSDIAHQLARTAADMGRYIPGSAGFDSAFNVYTKTSISNGGSQFADKSNMNQIEGQWNLSQYTKVVDVLAGADYRWYNLNSHGTIFADTAGKITIPEYGAYVQLQKSMLKDVLKLTASGRFDKTKNFSGKFTPRVTASVKVAKDNNIRLSYQQAYRFPTNQDQYINIKTPGTRLIGGLPEFIPLFHLDTNPLYTAESVVAFRNTGDPTVLKVLPFTGVKPESMQSFELGYRGIIAKKLLIDGYVYTSKYKDFIARLAGSRGADGSLNQLASPFTSENIAYVTNSPTPVKAFGWGISLDYQLQKGYLLSGNVYSDKLYDVPANLVTFFNTPKYRFNLGLANPDVYKGIGFNVIYKWQDQILWEGTFGTGQIPSFGTLDAAVSYKFRKTKSQIKLGGTNILNNYYRSAFGNPYVGGLYYISLGYNVL